MVAFTFTADSTTDQLAITGHGLQTGNGAAQVSNSGGGLPGGLAAATDYFAIRVDADHIKLATSATNALAGIAINITSNGTGTQTLTIGLPNARNTTYVSGSLVKSADLDAMQDDIVGARRRTWSRTFSPVALLATNFAFGANPVDVTFPPCWASNAGSASFIFGIPFDDGDRLVGFKYNAAGNGTVDVFGGIIRYAASMGVVATTLALWDDQNRAATWALVDVTAISTGPTFTSQVLAAGGILWVAIPANATGYAIGTCVAIFDRLTT